MSEGRWRLPEGWEWKLVEDFADVVGGSTPKASDETNFAEPPDGIPWLTPADLTDYEEAYISRGRRDLTEKGLESCSARIMPPGTVLYSSRAPIGYCAIAANEITTNQGFKNLVIRDHRVLPEYIRYYFLSAKAYAESQASGTTFLELSGKRMKGLQVPIAPPDLQPQVVAHLDDVTKGVRRTRDMLASLPELIEKFRQSVLAAAFRGDLTKEWREQNPDVEPASVLLERIRTERRERWIEDAAEKGRVKAEAKARKAGKPWTDEDGEKVLAKERVKAAKKYEEPEPVDPTGLPELPETWCWTTLETLAFIENGQTPKGLADLSSHDGEVPWFRVGDMNTPGNERLLKHAVVNLKQADASRLGVLIRPRGTIVFPKRGGAIATNKKRILAQPSSFDLNTMGLIPMALAADWVWNWFGSVDLGELAGGSAVPQLNNPDIKPLSVPLAPVDEAIEIANTLRPALETARSLSQAMEVATAKLERLAQSVLAAVFARRPGE